MRDILTPEQRERYIKKGGNKCPFCEDEGIEGGSVDIESGGASQKIWCNNCDTMWYDIYTLTDVQVIA